MPTVGVEGENPCGQVMNQVCSGHASNWRTKRPRGPGDMGLGEAMRHVLARGTGSPRRARGLGPVGCCTCSSLCQALGPLVLDADPVFGNALVFCHLSCLSRRNLLQADPVVLLTVLYIKICTAAEHPGVSSYGKAHSFYTASLINLIQTLACHRECLSRGEVFHLSPLSQGTLYFSFASKNSLWRECELTA